MVMPNECLSKHLKVIIINNNNNKTLVPICIDIDGLYTTNESATL